MADTNLQLKNNEYWLTEYERDHLKIHYHIKRIITKVASRYQEVMILDSYDFGRMLVLDGVVQTTEADGFIYNEMIVHVPMCIHPAPKRILIIGGGDCGAAYEVTKYDIVETIDFVEIDEVVVNESKKHLQSVSKNLSDSRVNYLFQDGIHYVKNCKELYDVILIDSSDPVGPSKPLFEKAFYHDVYHALKEDGIMVCQSQSPFMHRNVLQQTYQFIQDIFPIAKVYVATIPTYPGGMWSFTMGSKKYQELLENALPKDTHYVSKDILHSSFHLPGFVKRGLCE